MKNLLSIIAIVFVIAVSSCNDGQTLNGVEYWNWNDINDNAQQVILNSGVDTSKVIYYNDLTQSQKETFLSLGLDSTKPYKIIN